MTANDLIAAFETLADAPDGVKRLRELVLQLAVRGKLVPQDPKETVASALPDREVTGKKKALPAAATPKEVDVPYVAPPGWVWTTATALGDTSPRNHVADDAVVGFVPMAVVPKEYGASLHPEARPWADIKKGFTHIADGDIAVAKITPCFQNGKACVVAGLPNGVGAGTTELLVLRPSPKTLDPLYALAFFKSPDFVKGGVETFTGTAGQQRVSNDYFRRRPFPLPPLAEQHRIVARVDELMGLLDRLEAARTARDAVRRAARDAALAALRDAEDTDAVQIAWGRIAGQMDALFAEPEDVGPLRQAVLGLAVRGRLVQQDAKDEVARTHLHRLNGSTWKSATTDAGLPVLPPGWEWATAEQLASPESTITYGVLKPEWVERGVPTVRVRDLQDGVVRVNDVGQCDPARAEKFRKTTLKAGDLLIAKDGATLGKTAFVPPALAGGNITQHVLRFSIRDGLATRYVRLVVDSPHGQGWMLGETRGVALPGVNVGDFRRMPVPLPPIPEQHRIVAKVDALMTICDALEARLTTARDLHAQFAAAAVHHLDV